MARDNRHDDDADVIGARVAPEATVSNGPLFDEPVRTPMVRTNDHRTSRKAADGVKPGLSELQRAVLNAFRELGPLTDFELESLPRFERYSYSTVRKRRTELVAHSYLEECGVKDSGKTGTSSMTLWRVRNV